MPIDQKICIDIQKCMDNAPDSLDWTKVQSFCAVADTGSLSAAARKLGQSQPTIGRHIKAIEVDLGVELFRREPRGLDITLAGIELLRFGKEMQASAARLSLAAAGQSEELRGTVRITSSVVFAHYELPRIVALMRQEYPEIAVEIVASDSSENLLFREADIAIRMYRPTQLDVIARHVRDLPTGIFANTKFLDRVGRPTTIEQLGQMEFVGFDRNDLMIRAMRSLGMDVDRDFFPVRCDDQTAHWKLVCAGCGVGGAQLQIGNAEPLVERLDVGVELPDLPVWLVAPEALRTNARVRRVWDILVQELSGPLTA